jgi:hypothetical protein
VSDTNGPLETVEILEPLLLGQVPQPMTLGQSTIALDPMLLLLGAGVLGFAWFLGCTHRKSRATPASGAGGRSKRTR